MRNIYLIIILTIMVMGLGCAKTDGTGVSEQQGETSPTGGTGGQAGSEFTACPSGGIKISTAAQLKGKLSNAKRAENLCLTASFELNEWATVTKFTGKLYGQDKALTIKSFGTGAVGLIKRIAKGGQVKDLKIKLEGNLNNSDAIELGVLAQKNEGIIENVDVTAIDTVEVKGEKTVGGLVGENYRNGEIKSSTVAVNIIGGDDTYPAGGLVGENRGTIEGSDAEADVTGLKDDARVGGLVGENEGRITKSHATGAVKKGNRVGGLVGLNLDMGKIEKSYAKGKVEATGEDASAGGLVGENRGTIEGSDATGAVKKGNRVGGLVGLNLDMGKIEKSHAKGKVEATGEDASAGGLVGENRGTIEGSHATGAVKKGNRVGGLVGLNLDRGKIEGSHATGAVSTDGARSYAGGLVGRNHGKIEGSYAKEGDVTATGEYSYAGGLVGSNEKGGTIEKRSYATGAVWEGDTAGGLVGLNDRGTITNSYATGAVMISLDAGGLVGKNEGGTIKGSYATGAVEGNITAGGLVGLNNKGTIENSYATGKVKGKGISGGLVGLNNSATITKSYATGNVNGEIVGGLVGASQGAPKPIQNNFTKKKIRTKPVGSGRSYGITQITQSDITATTFTSVGWSTSVWKNLVAGQWPKLLWQP